MNAERALNRLAGEASPYLRQHAGNPVDWFPWGDEAFQKALAEDKPIFLSIGYAACHWCHVMERESFEDEAIAALLNAEFVCIKVDREERPDIDAVYMAYCQMATGAGGWPLTIAMTPHKQPFHAATYVPPQGRFGRLGMDDLVPRIADAWRNRRGEVLASAGQAAKVLGRAQEQGGGELDPALLQKGYQELMGQYDAASGGFGLQPKFPSPHRLVFLVRHGAEEGMRAAEHTLARMRMGGIFDQVGSGFHRYATDRDWRVPHFEKMLYDQALLALAYAEAHARTGNPFHAGVVREILAYVRRDMAAPDGGFYSAEDADSDGGEGRFYLWSAEEMRNVLGGEFDFVSRCWNISDGGNFLDEATGRPAGMNIPFLEALPGDGGEERLSLARKKLFEVRARRTPPMKDRKILADWNGLMVAAFARAGRLLDDAAFVEAAVKAAGFVETSMRCEDGRLFHRYMEGRTAVPGQLDDYAFMVFGLLELHAATLDLAWLERALHLDEILARRFWDPVRGGYFMTADDAEALIVRPKEFHDGALPSGNSVHMGNLVRLARLTGRPEFERQALETGRAFGALLGQAPAGFCQALLALQEAQAGSTGVVVVGPRGEPGTRRMLDAVFAVRDPAMAVLLKDPSEADRLEALAPFTKALAMVGGKATAYLCRGFACEPPANAPEDLAERLRAAAVTPPPSRS